jgi:tetratricopeptide (TPR) repeat protein
MNERSGVRLEVAALTVAMAALAVYALALANDFAFDDIPIVLGDPRLASLDLRAIFSSGYWQHSDLALYRPLTTLSFAVDWGLAGHSPAWFHLTNVLLHAAASVLVLLLLARLFPVRAALAGALVFAVHPVHVEAVANVVGRAELLAAVFSLAACLVWMRAGRGRGVATAGLFGLALLSKESAVMLPALLLLIDGARAEPFADGAGPWLRRNGGPVLALGAVALAWLAVRWVVLDGLVPGRVDPTLELAQTGRARILTALQVWPVFARLLFFPVRLLADYGPRILLPTQTVNTAAALGALLLCGVAVGGLAALGAGARRTAFGLLWFPVAVFPVSNLAIPIGVLVAERTLYLPSVAVSVGVAGLVVVLARASAPVRRAFSLTAAVVMALFAGRVLVRIPDWKSTDSIMAALVRDRPDSFRGMWHAARLMRARGDAVAANAAYDRALALWPRRQALVIEAAAWATDQGRRGRALELARQLVRDWPDDAVGYQLLAGLALDAGDRAAASRAIREGRERTPADEVLRRMAAALDSMGAADR